MRSALISAVVALTVTGCSGVLSPNDPYFEFQSERYRTKAAHEAFIGSIGLLRRSGRNHFEIKAQPKWANIEVTQTASIALDAMSTRALEANATSGDVRQIGNLKLAGKLQTEEQNKGSFSIFKVTNVWQLRDQLNSDENSKILDQLASDPDYRIVLLMATVYDHRYTQKLEGKTGIDWTLTKEEDGAPKLNAEISGGSTISLSYSDGTRYAYHVGRFCWITNEDGRKEIYDILVDLPGLDAAECPGNSKAIASQAT